MPSQRAPDKRWPLVIVGAGASGLMAAAAASRLLSRGVLLLDKEPRVGRKLLATGNGRCNLLHMRVAHGCYHGSGAEAAYSLLQRFPPEALLERFSAMGLCCRADAEGRVYPLSNQAASVLDVLRAACQRQGVTVLTDCHVAAIHPTKQGFFIATTQGSVAADRVLVACGGKASPSLGSDGSGHTLLASLGHTITPLLPAIVPLKTPPSQVRGLKGVRVQATLTLYADDAPARQEKGEALFTDYGVSGIAAMQLARDAQQALSRRKNVALSISLLDAQTARQEMLRRVTLFAQSPMESIFTGLLHRPLALALLRAAGIPPQASPAAAYVEPLARLLCDWRLAITGTQPFANAQVTSGGAALSQFDPDTLASRLVPGLYACGEVLDVDGGCGGYNLMWAWVSGIAAGEAAAQCPMPPKGDV